MWCALAQGSGDDVLPHKAAGVEFGSESTVNKREGKVLPVVTLVWVAGVIKQACTTLPTEGAAALEVIRPIPEPRSDSRSI